MSWAWAAALALPAACSGGSDSETAVSSGGSSASGAANGSAAASDGGAIGSSGSAGETGGECVDGAACRLEDIDGLCTNGSCQFCVDVEDDASCAAAYGDGRLCIAGACIEANCRTNADCGEALCTAHHCAGCTRDADCPNETPICNIGSATCVEATQCAGVTPGDACPVNDRDVCCGSGPSAICLSGCCTDENCGSDESCTAGICVSNTCPAAPTDHHYYVDPTSMVPGSGNGSTLCPFTSLRVALEYVNLLQENVDDRVTITLLQSISGDTEAYGAFPFVVPGNMTIEGASPDVVVTAAMTMSGFALRGSDIELRNLIIRSARAPVWDQDTAGVAVEWEGASAVLSGNLVIEGFAYGVSAWLGGAVALRAGGGEAMMITQNYHGLHVEQDGTASVETTGGTIALDGNFVGFVAYGTTTIVGEDGADLDDKSISVSENVRGGTVCAVDGNVISHVTFRDNGDGASLSQSALALVAGTPADVNHNAFFRSSDQADPTWGVWITGGATPLSGIHINYNYFHNNRTGICVGEDVVGKNLDAKYNRWSSQDAGDDCAEAAPTRTITFAGDCTSGKNVGRMNGTTTTVDVSNCAPLQIK